MDTAKTRKANLRDTKSRVQLTQASFSRVLSLAAEASSKGVQRVVRTSSAGIQTARVLRVTE